MMFMLFSRTLAGLLPLTLIAVAACSGDDRPDGGTIIPSGDTGVPPDSGELPDAGEGFPDAEPPEAGGPCNPVDGTGCAGDLKCLFVPNLNTQQCRMLTTPVRGHEQMCNGLDCDVGLVCLNLGEGQKCYGVCDPANGGVGCEDLSGMADMYVCQGLQDMMSRPLLYGACDGRGGACRPYEDMCAVGKVCSLPGAGMPSCEDEGAVAVGGDCSTDNCMRGGICIDLTGGPGPRCYVPCNPQMPMMSGCAMGVMCNGLMGQSFGICDL
jgi:hypothetical protein